MGKASTSRLVCLGVGSSHINKVSTQGTGLSPIKLIRLESRNWIDRWCSKTWSIIASYIPFLCLPKWLWGTMIMLDPDDHDGGGHDHNDHNDYKGSVTWYWWSCQDLTAEYSASWSYLALFPTWFLQLLTWLYNLFVLLIEFYRITS